MKTTRRPSSNKVPDARKGIKKNTSKITLLKPINTKTKQPIIQSIGKRIHKAKFKPIQFAPQIQIEAEF
jgi:hypothetical protein